MHEEFFHLVFSIPLSLRTLFFDILTNVQSDISVCFVYLFIQIYFSVNSFFFLHMLELPANTCTGSHTNHSYPQTTININKPSQWNNKRKKTEASTRTLDGIKAEAETPRPGIYWSNSWGKPGAQLMTLAFHGIAYEGLPAWQPVIGSLESTCSTGGGVCRGGAGGGGGGGWLLKGLFTCISCLAVALSHSQF